MVEFLDVFLRFGGVILDRQVFPVQDERIEDVGNRVIGVPFLDLVYNLDGLIELVIIYFIETVLDVF
ncbi:hypothetical protein D3C87_2063880 [compost metagenome]